MAGVFCFKQFSVDQSGCGMKINTDGVLLGALAGSGKPETIADIGTGTGVIALMLAQRYPTATVHGVEVDVSAAKTAGENFLNSPFACRLKVFPTDFERFFDGHFERKYDMVVSNPPFHLNSLESPQVKKSLAKHTDEAFFEQLLKLTAQHLATDGLLWLILPLQAAEVVKGLAEKYHLYLQKIIVIQSFEHAAPHREILALGLYKKHIMTDRFIIYSEPKIYTAQYQETLKEFLTIFG